MKLYTITILSKKRVTVLVAQTVKEVNQQLEEYVKSNWKGSTPPPEATIYSDSQHSLRVIKYFENKEEVCEFGETELNNTTLVVDNLLLSQNPPLKSLKAVLDQAFRYAYYSFDDSCTLHDDYDEEYEKECREERNEVELWLTKLGISFEENSQ